MFCTNRIPHSRKSLINTKITWSTKPILYFCAFHENRTPGLRRVGSCYGRPGPPPAITSSASANCATRGHARPRRLAERRPARRAGPWLAEADIVVSAVYHSASAVAQACLPSCARTPSTPTTTASAAHAGRRRARARGLAFTDVAIMGAIALLAERTPLLCAGQARTR